MLIILSILNLLLLQTSTKQICTNYFDNEDWKINVQISRQESSIWIAANRRDFESTTDAFFELFPTTASMNWTDLSLEQIFVKAFIKLPNSSSRTAIVNRGEQVRRGFATHEGRQKVHNCAAHVPVEKVRLTWPVRASGSRLLRIKPTD